MSSTVTVGQIANALGISPRGASKRATKECWKYNEVAVRGGRQRLYSVADLPTEIRDALARHQLMTRAGVPAVASVTLPAGTEAASTPAVTPLSEADLKSWQRKIMLARLALVREADRLSRTTPKMRAIEMIVEAGNAGKLPAELQRAAEAANAKRGDKTPLSATSLRRWIDDLHASGGQPIALAPGTVAARAASSAAVAGLFPGLLRPAVKAFGGWGCQGDGEEKPRRGPATPQNHSVSHLEDAGDRAGARPAWPASAAAAQGFRAARHFRSVAYRRLCH